jgi:predicted NBD/HSP70 family sugar kinase
MDDAFNNLMGIKLKLEKQEIVYFMLGGAIMNSVQEKTEVNIYKLIEGISKDMGLTSEEITNRGSVDLGKFLIALKERGIIDEKNASDWLAKFKLKQKKEQVE